MGKLTLHVDADLISAAKEEAAVRRTSVSKLVTAFFRALSAGSTTSHPRGDLPPITASLVGCIKGSDVDIEDYIDHLEERHS